MKKLAIVLLSFASLSSTAFAGDNIYSIGYRMGLLSKFSIKGMMTNSGEGELMLGKDSVEWIKTSGSGEDKTETKMNPWAFSTHIENAPDFQAMENKYVYITYYQKVKHNPFKWDTDYIGTTVTEVNPNLTPVAHDSKCTNSKSLGTYSNGARVGRIVKISQKGLANKSYEVIMQVGRSGGVFHELSITSKDMADCATDFLKAGRLVRVEYTEKAVISGVNRDTPYDIRHIALATEADHNNELKD